MNFDGLKARQRPTSFPRAGAAAQDGRRSPCAPDSGSNILSPVMQGGTAKPRKVAVIGAGVVGMGCASYLQRDGLKDRQRPVVSQLASADPLLLAGRTRPRNSSGPIPTPKIPRANTYLYALSTSVGLTSRGPAGLIR